MLKQCVLCRRFITRTLLKSYSGRSKGSLADGNVTPLRRLLEDASGFGEMEAKDPELQWATEPYAVKPGETQSETPYVDPKETTVLLFPGQGSQWVGMGKELEKIPAARDLYELASSVVGWDVARVCRDGPSSELTRRCQTAVLVTSLAALERAREERPAAVERARAAAGFSLGEITALVYAAALPLDAALRLVELRAAAMRACAQERRGGMLTLWLAPDADLPRLLRAARDHAGTGTPDPVCQVANYMYPGCKVIAGDEEALRYAERHGAALGVRRAARVRVEGAFHTPLMRGAEDALREALRHVEVSEPRLRVVSAVDARPYRDAAHVRRQLARHVTRPVRWEQALHALYARPRDHALPLTLTLGPGNTTRATLRQVNARAWDASLNIDV
ncbi:unnamed protein product [Chilo suppressalis]|uniref:Malonyl-CoA:ACP transacylase (MAT) domain-containing protein n=1 Tax=Chilo suppressalis TaxID=168631 RepID=A0ABN8BEG5_CHISP|nr:unnamed protein product [Chilo suppressalis]